MKMSLALTGSGERTLLTRIILIPISPRSWVSSHSLVFSQILTYWVVRWSRTPAHTKPPFTLLSPLDASSSLIHQKCSTTTVFQWESSAHCIHCTPSSLHQMGKITCSGSSSVQAEPQASSLCPSFWVQCQQACWNMQVHATGSCWNWGFGV